MFQQFGSFRFEVTDKIEFEQTFITSHRVKLGSPPLCRVPLLESPPCHLQGYNNGPYMYPRPSYQSHDGYKRGLDGARARSPLMPLIQDNNHRRPVLSGFETQSRHSKRFSEQNSPYHAGSLVDIACILTHSKYRHDVDDVLKRARRAGVGVVVIPGMTVAASEQASRIADRYPGHVFFTAGVHPHNADNFEDRQLEKLEALLRHPACVGMGEIGLDFNRNFSQRRKQIDCFEKQIELACKYDMPMLLHERDAHIDFKELLSRYQAHLPNTVLHCFTGSREEALVYLAMGFYIGITGHFVGTYDGMGLKPLLYDDEIPLDKLLVETDGPFMLPQPERAVFRKGIVESVSPVAQQHWDQCKNGRNEPCTLPLIVELVAGCMRRSKAQIAAETTRNAVRFFKLHEKSRVNLDDTFLS